MQRPEKIYLEEPIEVSGTKVNHTESGLKYLIDHYQHILSFPINEAKLKAVDRQHIGKMIFTYTHHLQLYEHERAAKTDVQPVDVPADYKNDQSEKEVPTNMDSLHINRDAT